MSTSHARAFMEQYEATRSTREPRRLQLATATLRFRDEPIGALDAAGGGSLACESARDDTRRGIRGVSDHRDYQGFFGSGSDGTRTRDLRRDRPAL
jgi:hypothetical protein